MEKAKLYKILNSITVVVLAIVALFLLIKLFRDRTIEIDGEQLIQSIKNRPLLSLLIILLLVPNWLVETFKWKDLIQTVYPLSWSKSIKSIIMGISVSLFTPNRIGDVGGRLLYVPNNLKIKVLYLTFICSISQLLITILLGIIAILFYSSEVMGLFNLTNQSSIYLLFSLLGIIAFFGFFNIEKLRKLHIWIFPKYQKKIEDFQKTTPLQKFKLLAFSFIRYQIFALQFYFLMVVFYGEIAFVPTYFALTLIYLFSSVIPTSILTEVPVRGSLAFFIFYYLNMPAEEALVATICMWIINLFVPALGGLLLLKDIRLFKTNKTVLH